MYACEFVRARMCACVRARVCECVCGSVEFYFVLIISVYESFHNLLHRSINRLSSYFASNPYDIFFQNYFEDRESFHRLFFQTLTEFMYYHWTILNSWSANHFQFT